MKRNKKLLSVFIAAAAVALGAAAQPQFSVTARADETEAVKTITGLGTGAITNPVQPESSDDSWSGSFVYYGKWKSESYGIVDPVRYRVLDKASNKFGVDGGSLFLDCDTVLYEAAFNPGGSWWGGGNVWEDSDVKAGLNGNLFLDKADYLTDIEKTSIAGSSVETHWLTEGTGAGKVTEEVKNRFVTYTPLTGEKIFLLDAEDVNGKKETDYASEPVEVKAVTASAAGYEGFYDGQAHGISVKVSYPEGASVKYGKSANSCTLNESPTFTKANDEAETVYYQVTADGYLSATGSADVLIKKPAPDITAPTAKMITYNGTSQELVNAGKVTGGTMLYALGTKEAAVQEFTASIPKGISAGTYYVWYKVTGDDDHTDIEPECVIVKMAGSVETSEMHRLYNPNSGEHFYTKSASERDDLISYGWTYEGPAWIAPPSSSTPVYRVYNPNSGEHHYTMSASEKDGLVIAGWKDEGIGWYSDDSLGVPLYRLYNPNASGQYEAGGHHYTKDVNEKNNLIAAGWRDEGIGWYRM